MKHEAVLVLTSSLCMLPIVSAQQKTYVGTNVTGQFVLVRTVNASKAMPTFSTSTITLSDAASARSDYLQRYFSGESDFARSTDGFAHQATESQPVDFAAAMQAAANQSLAVNPAAGSTGFMGLTHFDQRNSNGGNQFSIEPPSPSIAVGNGYILEGVNNAIQVYTTSGKPSLPRVLSTNELFGLAPAIDRATDIRGTNPTDMRVFFDHTINRWFVLQRALENDATGFPIDQSHLYLAVSQTADPTGVYNIYVMDTRDMGNPLCPCFVDFPQIGADQYGFYISSNEYGTRSQVFANAQILALSKASLAAGSPTPTAYRFYIPPTSGFEFAIQPATTPAGSSYFLASGGLEYFVSSRTTSDNRLAVWAMYNTSSLVTQSPSPILVNLVVPSLTYIAPDVAIQRPGPLPYGSTLSPPGALAFLDGGLDSRILSVAYSGGRLYATFATQVTDDMNRSVVGGGYVAFSPSFRAGALAAPVVRQGYLVTRSNHVLRPAIAVNAQGKGAIAFTLAGPDYYPSAAFVPIDNTSVGSIQIAAAGTGPEDGFTGYPGGFGPGVARWGDYSAAVGASDGSIWMATQYIPSAPRTEFANWGTYLARYVP